MDSLNTSSLKSPTKHSPWNICHRKSEVSTHLKVLEQHHAASLWDLMTWNPRTLFTPFPRHTLSPSRLGGHLTSCINYSYAELPHCLARDVAVLKFPLFIVGVYSRVVETEYRMEKGFGWLRAQKGVSLPSMDGAWSWAAYSISLKACVRKIDTVMMRSQSYGAGQ